MYEKVILIIRNVRPMLLPHWGNVEALRIKDKDAASAVTKLDEEIENFVSNELKKLDPNTSFVGEEFGGDREAERIWMLDPIDGTGHFIRGLPFCTTMLCLIEKGQVNFSLIYDFVNDQMYKAERGKGAYKNGQPIKVNNRSIDNAYVSWETHLDKKENLETFLKLREKIVSFKSVSSGWEFAMVAEGKLEGRISFDPHGKDYDFAPGALLVEEAGGKVANLGKNDYNYRNVDLIAANPSVFESLTSGENAIFPISQ